MARNEISKTGAAQFLRDRTAEAAHRDPGPSRSKLVRIGFGIGLLVTGILGLVLPILPGTILVLGGIWSLAREVPFFRRIRRRLQSRLHPTASRVAAGRAEARSVAQSLCTREQGPPVAERQRTLEKRDAPPSASGAGREAA